MGSGGVIDLRLGGFLSILDSLSFGRKELLWGISRCRQKMPHSGDKDYWLPCVGICCFLEGVHFYHLSLVLVGFGHDEIVLPATCSLPEPLSTDYERAVHKAEKPLAVCGGVEVSAADLPRR
jgi:hypothetical protein